MDAVISLLILGTILSLDNFRLAIALGAFKLSWRRALRIAVVFGLWDSISPLVGLLIGRYFGQEIGPAAEIRGTYRASSVWPIPRSSESSDGSTGGSG